MLLPVLIEVVVFLDYRWW